MPFDKALQYTYRVGSDTQHRLYWKDQFWKYEFLAGGILFDELSFPNEKELLDGLSAHGLSFDQFSVDDGKGSLYSDAIKKKMDKLKSLGMAPCAKHGLSSKNEDGSCEACDHADFPDDFKGTEG